jgi:hypothetical protein
VDISGVAKICTTIRDVKITACSDVEKVLCAQAFQEFADCQENRPVGLFALAVSHYIWCMAHATAISSAPKKIISL